VGLARYLSAVDFNTDWLSSGELYPQLKGGSGTNSRLAGVPLRCTNTTKKVVAQLMIGIDPHKATYTAVTITRFSLSSGKVRASDRPGGAGNELDGNGREAHMGH
jgi:hypothetical protein